MEDERNQNKEVPMSKEKSKATTLESTRAWVQKHASENLDLKSLNGAIADLVKKSEEAKTSASKLEETRLARKQALKTLRETLKATKAARKLPQVPPSQTAPSKKAAPKKLPAKN